MIAASDLAKLIDECENLESVAEKLNKNWEYVAQEYTTESHGGRHSQFWRTLRIDKDYEKVLEWLHQNANQRGKYRIVVQKTMTRLKSKVVLDEDR